MAQAQVSLMDALGFDRFAVAGHDRGGRVAYRLALDHPDRISRLAVLDMVPTLEMWEMMDAAMALAVYHWLFLAQPDGLPEALIGGNPDDYLLPDGPGLVRRPRHHRPGRLSTNTGAASGSPASSMPCARITGPAPASTGSHDAADRAAGRRITCPVLALWASHGTDGRPYDAVEVWRRWADDVTGRELPRGHFLPEEAPERRFHGGAAELSGSGSTVYDAEQRHGKGAGNVTTDIESRENYRHFLAIPTRWMDNDIYGHVNNVIYYSYFDTVINGYLIDAGRVRYPRGAGHRRRRRNDVQVQEIAGCSPRSSMPGSGSANWAIPAFVTKSDCSPQAIPSRLRPATSSTSSSSARPCVRFRSPIRSAPAWNVCWFPENATIKNGQ